jgi:MFS family permease
VPRRRAVIASTIGTTIEWYDFFTYGTAAGLIFGKLCFPNEDPLTATLAAFGTYFIGFVGRPTGAAIFGHYGDRIGRKATLIATMLCMGIATFLVAFVPTYQVIGISGAVILIVLRMIQGIGVGGEWGDSVLLALEWARHHGHGAWSPRGRSSGSHAASSSQTFRYWLSALGQAISSPVGAGESRLRSRSYSLGLACGFVLTSSRRWCFGNS